jgi:hypothetical protein
VSLYLSKENLELLRELSGKYIWWKTSDEAIKMPERVIAQVMNIGDYADVQKVVNQLGDAVLKEIMLHLEAGQMSEKSWNYWHYRLGLAKVDQVPPLPVRKFE